MCLQQMPERRDLPQPFRLPVGAGLALFQGHQAFPAQKLQQERPASAVLQDPRDIFGRERPRRARDQGTRFHFRQRSQERRIPENVEEGRAMSAVVRQFKGRGV